MPVILVIIALVAGCLLAYAFGHGYVYVGRTAAGWTTVHDDTYVMGERVRVLEVEGTYQSATYLDARWAHPVFPYHLLFDHLFDAWPAGTGPHTVAVLGGGGYAIPKHLIANHPEIGQVDVIEIDPAIERIARRHFFVDRLEEELGAESSGRLRLHLADAHAWLARSSDSFDAIINDCFRALEPDATLMASEGTRLIHSRLNQGGLYLTNVVSALTGPDSGTLYALIGTLRASFAHVWVYPCSPENPQAKDNNIVIASDGWHPFEDAWEWPDASS